MTTEERTELRGQRKRRALERALFIVKERLEDIQSSVWRPDSIEHRADWVALIELYEKRKEYLEWETGDETLWDFFPEYRPGVAHECREWRREYRMLKRRIRASENHPLSRYFSFASEKSIPNVPAVPAAAVLPALETIFPESGVRVAFGHALLKLGPKAKPEAVCDYVDDSEQPPDLPEGWITDGNERSFVTACANPKIRHLIQTMLGKVEERMRDEGYFRPVM